MTRLETIRTDLSDKISRWTQTNEDYLTEIPGLGLFCRHAPTRLCSCIVMPSIVLVVQGKKQLLIGEQAYSYNIGRFLITSLDLPAQSQILEATGDKPCLGLALRLDMSLMAELITVSCLSLTQEQISDESAAIGTVTETLLEPFNRLLSLLDEPQTIPILAPLIIREIHFRLLMSDVKARIWKMASVGSQSQRIAKAIDWLRDNYLKSFRIEELAEYVQLSTPSLHHHFKQLTAMSPLQYQKWLRLSEARRLMINDRMDAASTAYHVGYESPSQFNREYKRMFGAPPKQDVEALRLKLQSPPL